MGTHEMSENRMFGATNVGVGDMLNISKSVSENNNNSAMATTIEYLSTCLLDIY